MSMKFSKRSDHVKASDVRELLKVTQNPEIISFAGGFPAPELFPIEEMKIVCNTVLEEQGDKALQYSSTEGFLALRKTISSIMNNLGVSAFSEDIVITSGSQQCLDLTGKIFLDEGDIVICESPTYLAAISAFQCYLPRFVEVEMDDQGMKMDKLEAALKENSQAKFIYTIPDFQNPTGRTLSLERRKRIVELANEYDMFIIEDNPYGAIRFEGNNLPPIKHFDTEGRVIYVSTFSKTLTPGLRLGWVCANPEVLRKLVIFKQGADLNTNSFAQLKAVKYMELFDLEGHVSKIKEVYRKRKYAMLEAMDKHMPEYAKYTNPEGGLFIWVELPDYINAREVLAKSIENKVAFVPGGSFYPNGGHENTMRLNFSNMPEERIEEGIKRLAEVLKVLGRD
jgi:2-aminoadipate transaminase